MKNTAKESLSISAPGWLIEQLDLTVKKKFSDRSTFVCEAIRKAIAIEKAEAPEFWELLCGENEPDSS